MFLPCFFPFGSKVEIGKALGSALNTKWRRHPTHVIPTKRRATTTTTNDARETCLFDSVATPPFPQWGKQSRVKNKEERDGTKKKYLKHPYTRVAALELALLASVQPRSTALNDDSLKELAEYAFQERTYAQKHTHIRIYIHTHIHTHTYMHAYIRTHAKMHEIRFLKAIPSYGALAPYPGSCPILFKWRRLGAPSFSLPPYFGVRSSFLVLFPLH